VHRLTRPRGLALVALAGGSAALVVGSITTASSQTTTTPVTTATTTTTTTPKKKTTMKKKATKPKIICRARLVGVLPPGVSAENYGTVSCTGAAFGEGVQHDTAQLTRSSDTVASLTGRLKLFFNTGTLRGTYKATVTVTDGTATYKGSIKVSSGTGAFQGATGTGTIAGTTLDASHATLTERLALTIPARSG